MSTLFVLAALLGAVLGMRFKVLILIPAIGFALIVIIVDGIARGTNVYGILIAGIVASACLQIGYIFSIVTRYCIVSARAGRLRKISLRSVR
jgi:hypothetical protein